MPKKEDKGVFGFGAVDEVPNRTHSVRGSRYLKTVEQFNENEASVIEIALGDTKLLTATQGFRKAVEKGYKDNIKVVQRNGSLYLKKY